MSPKFLLFILCLYLAMVVSSSVAQVNPSGTHYRLKSGKKVRLDSIYVSDMTFDCEQEGKIRFHDPITDKVGFLGSRGQVVIPAKFNDARPFYNGLALVMHDAKRVCLDGKPYERGKCEHWMWDGVTALIDTSGRIVADHLNDDLIRNLNWYSAKLCKAPSAVKAYTSFKTIDGQYYSILNYEAEFNNWFYDCFLPGAVAGKLVLYDKVRVESMSSRGKEKSYAKNTFRTKYADVMKIKLKAIQSRAIETVIFPSRLNPFIQTSKEFRPYYTDCDEPNEARYPVFEVITTIQVKGGNPKQEHYEFLRTEVGYKLFGVAWQ